jgi:hypothetical protein
MSAGRSCPLHYRYRPESLARPPDAGLDGLDALYVAGGVYGNLEALAALLARFEQDPAPRKALVFNGDFHWFDIDPKRFDAVQCLVLRHHALRGNVETELADEFADPAAGCGCAYPDWVGDGVVERSNRILARLRQAATPGQRAAMGALPMTARARVGALDVAIVHGDAESLAGWGLAQEHLRAPAALRRAESWLDRAQADVIVSSHSCLPVFQRLANGAVLNNGAAGLPNFRGDSAGMMVRLGVDPQPDACFGLKLAAVHAEALRIEVDAAAQQAAFLAQWPEGSDAHESYWHRLCAGPDYEPVLALRLLA